MSETKRMRAIVWAELAHACYWEQYISSYLGCKYDLNKLYSVITIALSSMGAVMVSLSKDKGDWAIWTGMICIVMVPVVQLVKSLQKHVLMDADTASSLMRLRAMYLEYYNNMARLFLDIDDLDLSDEELKIGTLVSVILP